MSQHPSIACFRLALLPLLTFGSTCITWAAPPRTQPLNSGWHVRYAPGQTKAPTIPLKATTWLPAHVPGTVQSDLIAAGVVPDPFYRDQEAHIQWVGLSDWQYHTRFQVNAATLTRQHAELVFDGLDTLATVTLNGTPLLDTNNMFRHWRVNAKPLLKHGENILDVTLYSPIKKIQPWLAQQPYALPGSYDSAFGDEPAARHSATYVRKAPYQFGWDWGPRIVTSGLWKEVKLETWDATRIDDLHIAQQRVDASVAQLEAQLTLDAGRDGPAQITLHVFDPDGRQILQHREQRTLDTGHNRINLPVRITQPRRWFPAGYGAPDRYTFAATVRDAAGDIQRVERITGLRTVALRREQDQWGKSMALVVNGIPIFAKGANLIPLDSIPTRVTEATMRHTLEDAREANMNMLRIWGGGHYQDERFYTLADALGIMIWQDFMFGGAIPPDDVDFRENTRQEAIEQITRLRDHPSIVLWCGNNEVQTGWEHWDDRIRFKQSLAHEERSRIERGMTILFGSVLREAVKLYSPGIPYWATSPGTDFDGPADQTNDGDMHYWKVWGNPALPVTEYLNVTPRFMSEYGLQSFPDIRTIRTFARPEDLSPESQVMRAHQKFDNGRGNQRLLLYIRREFGEPKDFESFVYLSQLMQAEGIAIAAQHLRAARPQTMGSLYWQLNDVWPGASWSSIDYAGRWKALHYHARHFYAPVMIAALRKDGTTTVSLVSDRTVPLEVRWRLRVLDMDGTALNTHEQKTTIAPLSSRQIAQYSDAQLLGQADPEHSVAVFELLNGNTILSRQTVFFDAAKHLKLPQPHIRSAWKADHGMYLLTLTSPAFAREVWLSFGDIDARLSDNAFDLLPGEPLTVQIRSAAPLAQLQKALQIRDVAATLASAPSEPVESK
ncbi:glycoside hydrolase family 2 protein [Xylella taiwanensis]|uniref:Beta-mannosidase n=1 Tax=Xylella taiwanensis TaxID=1444770 RepID=Z9JNJ8_9GAMM|nr:glycoside hydrolase family 2 protein [Xylella taiwanensis]AXI84462.1 beta-mannosidase [Xylella taiwanensis]EWS79386.1 beta-mannosidase [Xylella taiwanensis]MCD8455358.1 glycoside hydrolase family 2 protein [Xylella taiwanensis]MCD8457762.1 glycoside hydrolase family 2 protein [Xylella taiwanensis]MCD8459897.1 glycoside hydrolase family 2 protein [Xylella taiwanensis]